MPNTLAHLGVHAGVTRALLGRAEPRWVFVGCVLPDLPWIVQRAVKGLAPGVDLYDLRLYTVVQASLAICLVLAGGLALLTRRPGRVFALVAVGSLLHLVLDACQTKWGNGVHLLAPLDWRLLNLGLFWPESNITLVLTLLGAAVGTVVLVREWRGDSRVPRDGLLDVAAGTPGVVDAAPPCPIPGGHLPRVLGTILLATYVVLPTLLMAGPEAADNHSVATLRGRADRPGRAVAFDRARFVRDEAGPAVITFAGERLAVDGPAPPRAATVSVQATFTATDRIRLDAVHLHRPARRDLSSVAGLAVVAAVWLRPARRRLRLGV